MGRTADAATESVPDENLSGEVSTENGVVDKTKEF